MLVKYPKDWQLTPLGDVTERFIGGGTPNTSVKEYWDGTIPWITGADAEQRIATTARKFVTEKGVKESSTSIVPEGNILLVTRTGVGKVSIAGVDIAISQDLTGVIPRQKIVDASYLYRQLKYLGTELKRLSQGTIIQGIKREEVKALPIPLPPLSEQRRIAEILDAADAAIRETARVIAKLREVKRGLLHDLLTRGLDAQGRLRDPDAHPAQFKDSPVGRIPRNWSQGKISDFASIDYGISDPIDQSLQEGIPTITLPCVSKNGDLSLDEELLALTEKTKVSNKDILQPGDLLFNWRSGSRRHLGKTAYFDQSGKYTHVGFLLRLRIHSNLYNARFLWWHMTYLKNQGYFLRAKSQVNNTFNSSELAEVPVPAPNFSEQLKIVDALDALDARIRAEEAVLAKRRQVKRGLMDDLLTGKVRV